MKKKSLFLQIVAIGHKGNDKIWYNNKKGVIALLNVIIGIVILLVGLYFMFKFFGSSPSLKKRDEHNKKNPTDDSISPPNTPNGGGH
jgi:flagellar basal body-associated protein FliL